MDKFEMEIYETIKYLSSSELLIGKVLDIIGIDY